MPRHLLPLGLALGLLAGLLWFVLAPIPVGGQAVPIRGTASTQSGEWNIRHIGAQLHIANTAALSALAVRCVNTGGTAFEACGGTISSVDTVNTLGHLSSVVHIQVAGAGTPTQSLPVRCVNTAGTAFEACGGAGAAADSINVFHQSTIRHISSVTHVSGNLSQIAGVTIPLGAGLPVGHIASVLHIQVSGSGTPTSSLPVRCVNTAGTAFADCGGAGSAADAVNVFHQSTVRHVSSVTHVAIVDWQRWAHVQTQAFQSGAWIVTASHIANMPSVGQGGVWTIQAIHQAVVSHVSSVTHVFGFVRLVNLAGTNATLTGSSLDVNVTNTVAVSQSGTWTVQPGNTPNTTAWLANIGHISALVHVRGVVELASGHSVVISHVSSMTHVSGRVILQNVAGSAIGVTSNALDVNVTNATLAVTQSGTWTVQPGNTVNTSPWLANVFHVSSQVHVIGRVILQNVAGTAVSVTSTSLDTNITNATLAVTQSGTWTAQPGNTPNTTAWLVNVQHVSSQLHMNIAGVGGLPIPTSQGLPIQHIASVVHVAISGLGTPTQAISVRCVNTGATAFADCGGAGGSGDAVNVFHQSTIAHVSSVTHIAIAGGHYGTGQLSMHVSGVSNIGSGRENTGTTPMVCHSTLAIHFSGGSFSGASGFSQAIIHLTSTNKGINQSTWRIYICSVVLFGNALSPKGQTGLAGGVDVARRHFAATYSLVEGTGSGCATGRAGVMGFFNAGGSILIDAHTAVQLVSPFPFMSTNVLGNDLCLLTSNRNSRTYVTGVMSYRAAP